MPKKPQYLNEAFLPNLDKAPMPLQSIANRDFARAYRRAISEVAHSDEEDVAQALAENVEKIMSNVEDVFGPDGERDHRAVEAYELLFRAAERLRSIYEMRE